MAGGGGGGGGKITKLLKKVQSLGKSNRRPSRTSSSSTNSSTRSSTDDYYTTNNNYSDYSGSYNNKGNGPSTVVYVGKSRRRYLLSTEVTTHPLFQELIEREISSYDDDEDDEELAAGGIVVGCEVVLFEHLLWMLRNADPQPESSLDELADYYACS